LQQLYACRCIDVAFEFAAYDHRLCAHATSQLRTGLDREIALYVDVAFEVAGDANVAGTFDLAFDRESRCKQRFFSSVGASWRGRLTCCVLIGGGRGGAFGGSGFRSRLFASVLISE
jgi:hypothetical protein